jgi:hypothetical protein
MLTFKRYIAEALDKPYEYDHLRSIEFESGESEHRYGFKDKNGIPTHVYIIHHTGKAKKGRASVVFTDEHDQVDATGKGTIRHISTVKRIMQDHAKNHPYLKTYMFAASKQYSTSGGGGRARLYTKLTDLAGGKTKNKRTETQHNIPINRDKKGN